ncbi:O-antigen ligase family protein [Patescibacteria group bacterium]|nr:O-antigen ligase family protein [Patescibacteria group bacterium]MBU1895305.1 O-antigen ligase family protein [Patescibacteria group bacterium]
MEKKITLLFNLEKVLEYSLGLFLFLLPWQTIWIYREGILNGSKWQYGTLGIYGTEFLLWVSIILFIFWFYKKWQERLVKNEKFKFTKDRIFILSFLTFVLYVYLSSLWAVDGEVAMGHAFHILEASLLFIMLYLGPLQFKQASYWLIGGAVIQSVLGIWQFFSQSTFEFKWLGMVAHETWEGGTSVISSSEIGRWLRAYGSFSHPNVFGGYLVLTILATLILTPFSNHKNKIGHPFLVIALLLQFTALVFTFSRSAWIAVALVLLFYIYIIISRGKKIPCLSYFSAILILWIFLIMIFFPLVRVRVGGEAPLEVRSTNERLVGYEESLVLFRTHPWFGVGVGNYTAVLHEYNPNLSGWLYQPVHNAMILVLVELGIVGFLITSIIFITYYLMHSMIRHMDLVAGLLFIGIIIPLLFLDHYLFSSYTGLMVWAIFWSIFLTVYPISFRD